MMQLQNFFNILFSRFLLFVVWHVPSANFSFGFGGNAKLVKHVKPKNPNNYYITLNKIKVLVVRPPFKLHNIFKSSV